MVLSEVAERLMMMSGAGASTCATECGRTAASRNNEVTQTTVPAGHRRRGGPSREQKKASGFRWLAPFEGGAVDPDAMKDYGNLSGDSDLSLFRADPLGELHAPSFQAGPFLSSVQQHGCRLKQVGSEQSIAPARYSAVCVSLTGLIAPRREPEIGTDG
jgi:hypothetical protein